MLLPVDGRSTGRGVSVNAICRSPSVICTSTKAGPDSTLSTWTLI